MLPFRKLSIGDRERIELLLKQSFFFATYTSSEFVFENVYVWNYQGQIEIAWCDDDMAIIRSMEKESRWIYFPPLAISRERFAEAIGLIKGHCPDAIISGLNQAMVDAISDVDCLILYDDYYSEYIYDAKELAQMSGGKYSRKRNQIAQFKRKYQYVYRQIEEADLPEVESFLDKYRREGGSDVDFEAIRYALAHRRELNLFSDCLLIDSVVVGLSIGAVSVFNHGVVLFEKNDYDYVGSGAILVQLFVSAHFLNTKCMTRQEDLGLPELRKAKMSLHPLRKERKYACIFDEKVTEFHNLYCTAFDDSRDYVDFFFLHQYRSDRAHYVEKDGKIRSALHVIPKKMIFSHREYDLPFIVAAATEKGYRRMGLMREVMQKTFRSLLENGEKAVALYPVDPAYYDEYGFVFYTFSHKVTDYAASFECTLEQTVDIVVLNNLYETSVHNCQAYILRDMAYWISYLNSLHQDKVVFDLIRRDGIDVGYAAHCGNDIDEMCLCVDECPIHQDIDFSQAIIPFAKGDIPSNMIRILDAVAFLRSMNFKAEIKISMRMRITDDFLEVNNATIWIMIQNGRLISTPCKDHEITLSIKELTEAIFLGRGSEKISFLFPDLPTICFDKF